MMNFRRAQLLGFSSFFVRCSVLFLDFFRPREKAIKGKTKTKNGIKIEFEAFHMSNYGLAINYT